MKIRIKQVGDTYCLQEEVTILGDGIIAKNQDAQALVDFSQGPADSYPVQNAYTRYKE